MLPILDEFRERLDNIMIQSMHSRVLLYGYESYTGRFIKWYAEYYHSIKIDYLVSTDMSRNGRYDLEVFRPTLLNFNYKDVSQAIVWVAEPMTEILRNKLESKGYVEEKSYFDFYKAIYGSDICESNEENVDIFKKRKDGRRDIQFLEWLEWKYGCNFVTHIAPNQLEIVRWGGGYTVTTQKEIFPILDHCHCIPQDDDAIFDYGCGKGGALISFLDYGFKRVGGVEYEPKIYEVLKDNINRLGLEERCEVLYGDAGELTEQIDGYNWFFSFTLFAEDVVEKCVKAICDSYRRKKRKIRIVSIAMSSEHECIEQTGRFRLTNQFTIDTRSRVVNIFESYECGKCNDKTIL